MEKIYPKSVQVGELIIFNDAAHMLLFDLVTWGALHHYILKPLVSVACGGKSLPDLYLWHKIAERCSGSDCPTCQHGSVSNHPTFLLLRFSAGFVDLRILIALNGDYRD